MAGYIEFCRSIDDWSDVNMRILVNQLKREKFSKKLTKKKWKRDLLQWELSTGNSMDVGRLNRLEDDANFLETRLTKLIQEGRRLDFKMHTQINVLDSAAAEYKAAVRHGQIAPNEYMMKERVHLRAAYYLDQITHPPDGDGEWAFAYRVSQSEPHFQAMAMAADRFHIDWRLLPPHPIPIAAIPPPPQLPPP